MADPIIEITGTPLPQTTSMSDTATNTAAGDPVAPALEADITQPPPQVGLPGLADPNYKYWEAENYDPDPDEPRVKMGTNSNMPKQPLAEVTPELAAQLLFWNLKEPTLSTDKLELVAQVLEKYKDVFAKDEYDLGRFTSWEHTVNTGDHAPIKAKPRNLSQEKLKCLDVILDNLERTHQIRRSRSDWASGIVMVKKKDGTWRMCMDFRPLNRIATCCQFPLPRINDLLQSLSGAVYFSALDLAKGFHQIPLKEEAKSKLAFVTPRGQWEWETTPMGLHSAPAAFQAAMQQTLAGLQQCTLVYVDDIVIFTKTFEEHVKAIEVVLQRLREFNLKASRPKCDFCRTEIAYLGHVVNAHGIHTDPKKTEAVSNMPSPTCTLEVETFLGKTGYYQRFIPHYAGLAKPLMDLKKKSKEFQWGEAEEHAFRTLIELLCTAPILRHYNEDMPLFISTDASGYALGAVLFQKYGENGEQEVAIAYASRRMIPPEMRYSATEREALAIYWACNHFIDYVDERPITIYTDHKALLALPQNEMSNRRLERYAHKLAEFQYTLEYRPGTANANADALSRYPIVPCKGRRSKEVQTNESCFNNYDAADELGERLPKYKRVPFPGLEATEVTDEHKGDLASLTVARLDLVENRHHYPEEQGTSLVNLPPNGQVLAVELTLTIPSEAQARADFRNLAALQDNVPEFWALRQYYETGRLPATPVLRLELLRTLDSFYCGGPTGALRRINPAANATEVAICLPPELYLTVLYDAHCAPASGHFGIAKTLARVQARYWWPGMAKYVVQYVAKCPLCQAHKDRPRPPREKLGDRPPPEIPWERLHMDVWSPGGRSTRGNLHVLGVIDTFSKFLILVPMPDQKAPAVADAMIDHVIMPYGMPWELVSDQGRNFTSTLQTELYRIFGIARKVTSPYRPQTNGQIERMFRTVRPILATLANAEPHEWDKYLTMAAHSYNTSFHAGIQSTPFTIMYGRRPDPLPEHCMEAEKQDNIQRIRGWKLAREAAMAGLMETQRKSKAHYDARRARPQPEFTEGDCVLCRVPSPPKDSISKLYVKYIGPYRILTINGPILRVTPIYNQRQGGEHKVIHKDRVKPCEENYPNIHTWTELQAPFTDPSQVDPNLDSEDEED